MSGGEYMIWLIIGAVIAALFFIIISIGLSKGVQTEIEDDKRGRLYERGAREMEDEDEEDKGGE
jgi:hypothetical protein